MANDAHPSTEQGGSFGTFLATLRSHREVRVLVEEHKRLRRAAQAVIDDALVDDASRGLFTVDADKLTDLANALDE